MVKLDPNTCIFVRPGCTAVVSPFDTSHECEMRTIEAVDPVTGIITVNNNTPFEYAGCGLSGGSAENIHITATSGTEIELGAHSNMLRDLVRASSVSGRGMEGGSDKRSGAYAGHHQHLYHSEERQSADGNHVPCVLTMPPASVGGLSVYRIVDAAGCSAAAPISVYTQTNLTTPLVVLTSSGTNITIFSDLRQYRTFGGFSGPQAKDSDIASLAVSKLIGPGLQYTLLSGGEVVAFTPTSDDANAPDEFNASVGTRIDISLEYVNQMRWSLNVPSGDSGFTALCGIQYSLDNGSTWAWIDGVYGNGIRVNSTGHKSAGYVNIESAAKSATRALIRMAAFDSSGKRMDINSIHIYLIYLR